MPTSKKQLTKLNQVKKVKARSRRLRAANPPRKSSRNSRKSSSEPPESCGAHFLKKISERTGFFFEKFFKRLRFF